MPTGWRGYTRWISRNAGPWGGHHRLLRTLEDRGPNRSSTGQKTGTPLHIVRVQQGAAAAGCPQSAGYPDNHPKNWTVDTCRSASSCPISPAQLKV